MKLKLNHLLIPAALFVVSGCAHSSSDVKLSEVENGQGVLFGHVDLYKNEKQLGTGWTTPCFLSFSDEKEDTLVKVKVDETGWILASVPVGKVYLSEIYCKSGYLQSDFTMKPHGLSFSIPSEKSATYFGTLTVRFNYYRPSVLSGKVPTQIKIENQFDAAQQEFQKRFGADAGSFKLIDATIARDQPASEQGPEPQQDP